MPFLYQTQDLDVNLKGVEENLVSVSGVCCVDSAGLIEGTKQYIRSPLT